MRSERCACRGWVEAANEFCEQDAVRQHNIGTEHQMFRSVGGMEGLVERGSEVMERRETVDPTAPHRLFVQALQAVHPLLRRVV